MIATQPRVAHAAGAPPELLPRGAHVLRCGVLPRDPTLPLLALLIASSVAATLTLFPAAVQGWSRRAFDRRPWLRALTPACDFAALTDVRSAWMLRVYGLVLVPVTALAARAVVEAFKAG